MSPTTATMRKRLGKYYTPRFVVDCVVEKTLDPLLVGKSPAQIAGLKILDPACGDGAFLLAAFDYLQDWYRRYSIRVEPRQILRRQIFGVDVDAQATADCREKLRGKANLGAESLDLSENITCRDYLTDAVASKFDAIIGNPPYVRIQNLPRALIRDFDRNFSSATGKYDLYILFVEQAMRMLSDNGRLGFIVPNKFLTADYGRGLRKLISSQNALAGLIDLGEEQVFGDARTYTCLLFLRKGTKSFFWSEIPSMDDPARFLNGATQKATFKSNVLSEKPWMIAGGPEGRLLGRLLGGDFVKLADVADRVFQGLISGSDRLLYLPRDEARRLGIESSILRPLLKGPNVRRYRLEEPTHVAVYPYELCDGLTKLMSEKNLATYLPGAYRYLRQIKDPLRRRGSASMKYESWYAYWCPRDASAMGSPKILTQVLARGSTFAFDREGRHFFVGGGNAGVYGIILNADWLKRGLSYPLLLAILNSRVSEFVIRRISSRFRGGYFSHARRFIERLPILPSELNDVAKFPHATRMISLVSEIEKSGAAATEDFDHEIDRLVFDAFDLSPTEIRTINRCVPARKLAV